MQTSEAAPVYGENPPTTWAEARTYGIGGSEAAAVLGVNPWCSPYALWCRKAGLAKPIEQTEAMRWGHRLEDAIAAYYAEAESAEVFDVTRDTIDFLENDGPTVLLHPCKHVHRPSRSQIDRGLFRHAGAPEPFRLERFEHGTIFRSDGRQWQLASVDRLVLHPTRGLGGLECKNVGFRVRDHWNDGPPEYVRAQCDHYMAVTGLTWWAVAVLFEGRDPGWSVVERDEGRIERLIATESAFWESLERGEAPAPDGSESTRAALAEVYPRPELEQTIALPDEALAWDAGYLEAKEAEKAAKNKARGFETLIRAEIGSAQAGVLPSGVTWNSTTVLPSDVAAHTRAGYRKYSRRKAPKVGR